MYRAQFRRIFEELGRPELAKDEALLKELEEYSLEDVRTAREAGKEGAQDQLVAHFVVDGPSKSELFELATVELAGQCRDQLFENAGEELRLALRTEISQTVKTLMETGIQATDSWGKPKGQPRTLREIVTEEITACLRMRVREDDGKPPQAFYAGRTCTLVEYMMREALREGLREKALEHYKAILEDLGKK